MSETKKVSAEKEPKQETKRAAIKEPTANGFAVSDIIQKIRTLYGKDDPRTIPVQQALVLILGWNWRYDFEEGEDGKKGKGTLRIIGDTREELASFTAPGDFRSALRTAFGLAFGFAFVPEPLPKPIEKKPDPVAPAAAKNAEEETADIVPVFDEDVPFLEEPQPIPKLVAEKPIPKKQQSGFSAKGFVNDPNALPDRFPGRVVLLSNMEPMTKNGQVIGYGARVQCRGQQLYLRYWANNCEQQINPAYLASLSAGNEIAGVFTKYVNKQTGEVQILLQGFANAVS